MKIGFIGLGNMGHPMCRNLAKHGHALKVYDVVPELVKRLASGGCEATASIAACVSGVEMVITMLPSSPHVRSVRCDPDPARITSSRLSRAARYHAGGSRRLWCTAHRCTIRA